MKSKQMKESLEVQSEIHHPYTTIQITQSRLDKGLLALPTALATEWFPDENSEIKVLFEDSNSFEIKNYSSFSSKTREARIGGLASWFKEKRLQSGDEIVIQMIDKQNSLYRLTKESNFIREAMRFQSRIESEIENEAVVITNISNLSRHLALGKRQVCINEFSRFLREEKQEKRTKLNRTSHTINEPVPNNLRILLEEIYLGHCQVCDFFFLKKDNRPYYEIHHISPSLGHHLRNIVLVCANCHRQFTYANVEEYFGEDNWLIRVAFNGIEHRLNQIGISAKMFPVKKRIFTE